MLNQNIHINPVLPEWIVILLFLLAIGLTLKTYWKVDVQVNKWLLLVSRFVSISILSLLLLNPSFTDVSQKPVKPEIGFLIDQSESVLIKNGSYSGENDYKSVLNSLSEIDTSKVSINYYGFSQDVHSIVSTSEISANGIESDLFTGISYVLNQSPDLNSLVIISDGNYTTGRDPFFAAQTSPYPIHAIALGDTVQVIDLKLTPLKLATELQQHAKTAIYFSVESEALTSPQTSNLDLIKNGRLVSSKKATFPIGTNRYIDTLFIESEKLGQDSWEIRLQPISGEFTTKNNQLRFGTITKNPIQKVLHVAFGIHPDVKTFRTIAQSIENISIVPFTWLGQNRFLEGSFSIQKDSIQAIVIHGSIPDNIPKNLSTEINQLIQSKPTLFLLNPSTQFNTDEQVNEFLPVIIPSNWAANTTTVFKINPTEINHPIVQFPNEIQTELIPLSKTLTASLFPKSDTKFIAFGYEERLLRDYPLIAIRNYKSVRTAQFLLSDFYVLLQHGGNDSKFISQLIFNTLEWLIAPNQENAIQISLPERNVSDQEIIPVIVQVKNESGQLIDDANIQATISTNDSLVTSFNLASSSDGIYTKNLGPFSEGLYTINVQSVKNGEIIAKKQALLTIANTASEYRTIMRNQQNLFNIVSETQGKLADFRNYKGLLGQIISDASAKSKLILVQNTYLMIDNLFWYLLLFLMLLSEWLIRKKIALT
ncbi:hypothetical protein EP331_10555 [bacterium]|nr:MAG: hypothetical protein EP331_10555 [bacterium]